jgi:hypothetical protein
MNNVRVITQEVQALYDRSGNFVGLVNMEGQLLPIGTGPANAEGFNGVFPGIFSISNYSGTTDQKVTAALTALYANKGGILHFPYQVGGYTLNQPVVIDPALVGADGTGITVDLGGNLITLTHAGIGFDIKTNYFFANNYTFGRKPVYVKGEGATIFNTNTAAPGCIRLNDQVSGGVSKVTIRDYPNGYAVQLNITSNDQSTWVEHCEIEDVKGSGCLNGIHTRSTHPNASFLGNVFRRCVFEGTLNNTKNFNLEGLMFNCTFEQCGGYYDQGSATGGCCFYLNGGYTGSVFITPWVDAGGEGTQAPESDIVFGPLYTNTQTYYPMLVGTIEINLPVDWRDRLLLPGVIGFHTLDASTSANVREVLRDNRTYYVATTGNDSNNGKTAAKPFATIQKAIDVIYSTIDLASKDVTIQLADGTYTAPVLFGGLPLGLGNASFILKGNAAIPGNVVIAPAAGNALTVRGSARITLQGIRLQAASGNGLVVNDAGSAVYLDTGCQFGACSGKHMAVNPGARITIGAAYSIKGNAQTHWEVNGGMVIKDASIDATNIAFSGNFTNVYNDGKVMSNNTVFTTAGSTGTRYYVYDMGLIQTYGAGDSIFPGNNAGYADTGSFGLYK